MNLRRLYLRFYVAYHMNINISVHSFNLFLHLPTTLSHSITHYLSIQWLLLLILLLSNNTTTIVKSFSSNSSSSILNNIFIKQYRWSLVLVLGEVVQSLRTWWTTASVGRLLSMLGLWRQPISVCVLLGIVIW